ncbi:hypothetical protein GCM10027605_07340 [Micromonospora zhanjiangensis]
MSPAGRAVSLAVQADPAVSPASQADPGGLPRGRWWRWFGLGLVAVLLLCGAPVAVLAAVGKLPGRSADAAPGPARSPRPGDPDEVVGAWLAERIRERLDRQAEALLRGDEAGFLAVSDPARPGAAQLRREFRSLRALRVVLWRPELRTGPTRVPDRPGEWRQPVTFQHCYAAPGCPPGGVTMVTRWAENGAQPRLVGIEPSVSADEGPRPWEVDDLVVAAGRRVVVATTADLRGRLSGLLAEADRAAAVADRYAVTGAPPDRYRIFLAGPPQWKRWYGGDLPEWTAGYAASVGGGGHEVVLNAKGLTDGAADELLRHEMTHAASLVGRDNVDKANWWLVEGIAEHAAAAGRPPRRYPGLPDVRRLLGSGWDGRLADLEPARDAAGWRVSGSYGIGYLAFRHLVDRYGESTARAFFTAVVRDGRSAEEAARKVFGEDWSALHDDCVAYLRSVTG